MAEYQEMVKERVLDEQTFVKLTMKGKVHGQDVPWRQITVRPVLIKDQRHLQFSYFDAKRDITKNYQGSEAAEKLSEILAIPFSSIRIQSTNDELQLQVTKKGKAIIHRSKPVRDREEPTLAHNRSKALPLPADKPDPFLQTIGIMNEQGQVRPHMQDKFSQINEFLKLLEHTGELEGFEHHPVNILDCGSGSASLTFATYHYLNDIRGIPARIIGVDVNEELIRKSAAFSDQLQTPDVCFHASPILEFQPDVQPDIVLALHACNTATDEAIAQGILGNARMVLCVPCCHHDLNQQIKTDTFRPILRHGILKQRMADILTDAFRALVLRIMGYKTEVIEFISSEHTARNLMIRAVKSTEPGDKNFIQEYHDLKAFWKVTPHIEKLLGDVFKALLQDTNNLMTPVRLPLWVPSIWSEGYGCGPASQPA